MNRPIYMDNHATTPVDPRVLAKMLPCFTEAYGNAASRTHAFGWQAEALVEQAREQVAALIGADPREIVWTSGATESDNLALKGVAANYAKKGRRIVTVCTEHKAVLDSCKWLESQGFEVVYLPVDKTGLIDLDQLRDSIDERTILVSAMHANNEIGVVQPIEEIGRICREKNTLFHSDAVQAAGKIPLDVNRANLDLVSLSAHKMYGPKGVGALYVRRRDPRVRLAPLIHGGGHERGMRSGTLNVPGIVGFGEAARIAREEMPAESARLEALRDRLEHGIVSQLEEAHVNGHPTQRLPHSLNISFAWVEGESLIMGLSGIAVSSGSACTSATLEPSYVLSALGVGDDLAHSSIRFGLGRFNTGEEVDFVIGKVVETVKKLRAMSPLADMARSGIDLNKVEWKH